MDKEMNLGNVDIVLFDLGGVLVELGPFPIDVEWYPDKLTEDDARNQWLASECAQDFEKGLVSAQQFAQTYIRENRLDVSEELFLQKFLQWPKHLYPGVHGFLASLQTHIPIAVFSNTNELHWRRLLDEMDLKDRFDYFFASQIIGKAKPDTAAFNYVAKEMGRKPEQILFLDDNINNVNAAIETGMHAEQVLGFDNAKSKLEDLLGAGIFTPRNAE